MSSVFPRAPGLEHAVSAEGSWITGADGRRYLDAAGGAIVSSIGHGRIEVAEAIASQVRTLDYVHATTFTSAVVEEYSARVAARVPIETACVFPVSGGSEATETALKMARTYQELTGHPERTSAVARWGSYHGNTLGALDLSGRVALRSPYEEWLGRFRHLPAVYEYRCPVPSHPVDCGRWHADQLAEAIAEWNPAAFIAEPISGASLGACVPPDDYWPRVSEVCRDTGTLLIVDEVMTGFGRTGAWFGIDHWAVQPDLIVAGKGASSGYWPLGLAIASGEIAETIAGSFVHGFTYSHHPGGAAAGLAVLDVIEAEALVERSARIGGILKEALRVELLEHPLVGEVRGRGMLIGIELVADRATKAPFPRESEMTGRLIAIARESGLLLYPASRGIDGTLGDAVLIGPPLNLSEADLETLTDRLLSSLQQLG